MRRTWMLMVSLGCLLVLSPLTVAAQDPASPGAPGGKALARIKAAAEKMKAEGKSDVEVLQAVRGMIDRVLERSQAPAQPARPQGQQARRGMGPGMGPGMGAGMGRGMGGGGMGPGMGAMGRGMGPGMGAMGRGMGPGMGAGMRRGMGPGMGAGMGRGMGQGPRANLEQRLRARLWGGPNQPARGSLDGNRGGFRGGRGVAAGAARGAKKPAVCPWCGGPGPGKAAAQKAKPAKAKAQKAPPPKKVKKAQKGPKLPA